MLVIPLQSGSNGNCIYVEAGDTRLLFDAGISGKQAKERLASFGRDINKVDGVIISHDHSDHTRCLGIYQRKFGIPLYVTKDTLTAAGRRCDFGPLKDVRFFRAGLKISFGGVTVETIPTPHDGVDGVAFVVDDGRHRVGIMTDLGHVFRMLEDAIGTLDGVVLESNYDPDMLENGPYPAFLKRRISGPKGHISNGEAAGLLKSSGGERLQWACLAHLSEENNRPEVALRAHQEILGERIKLHVARRYEATDLLELAHG